MDIENLGEDIKTKNNSNRYIIATLVTNRTSNNDILKISLIKARSAHKTKPFDYFMDLSIMITLHSQFSIGHNQV